MLYTELDIEDILADARENAQWENDDRLDHLRDRFRNVIRDVRGKMRQGAPSNEHTWLLRLESEIRKAYAASWQQESFNNAEVEYILRMLDVERA